MDPQHWFPDWGGGGTSATIHPPNAALEARFAAFGLAKYKNNFFHRKRELFPSFIVPPYISFFLAFFKQNNKFLR
jgi:hypothetical protein